MLLAACQPLASYVELHPLTLVGPLMTSTACRCKLGNTGNSHMWLKTRYDTWGCLSEPICGLLQHQQTIRRLGPQMMLCKHLASPVQMSSACRHLRHLSHLCHVWLADYGCKQDKAHLPNSNTARSGTVTAGSDSDGAASALWGSALELCSLQQHCATCSSWQSQQFDNRSL